MGFNSAFKGLIQNAGSLRPTNSYDVCSAPSVEAAACTVPAWTGNASETSSICFRTFVQQSQSKTFRAFYLKHSVGGHEWVYCNHNAEIVYREYINGRSGLIPQSFQLRAKVTLANPSGCHKMGECPMSFARKWTRFCNQSGRGCWIHLLTL